jgi:hypothetical protein
MNHTFRQAVPLLALSLAPPFAANAAPPEPDGAASAAASYRSAFTDYKPWRDITPGDWRKLNGHDAHSMPGMRDMSPAPAPASPSPAIAASAAPHSMQGAHQ